ncbi:MAG TPA: hypothetical protein VL946_11055 [Lacibacter sp.]|nr:hypothetical protein [Lacibacter sp.]
MTANSDKPINIEFKISSIELIEKSFQIPEFKDGKLPETQFDLMINFSINKPNKRFVSMLQVKVRTTLDELILANITVACSFDILNFEEVVVSTGETMGVPDPIVETLNIITIGTVRGIMFSEFKGTWLHNTILPVIDPKSFKQTLE